MVRSASWRWTCVTRDDARTIVSVLTVASAGNYFRNAEVQVCKEDRIIAFGLLEHDAVHTTIVPTDFADWTAAGVRTDRVCCQL